MTQLYPLTPLFPTPRTRKRLPQSGFVRNASAVSDAPRPTPEIYLPLTTGRVRYSCLKEAAGAEAFMQIQWGCGDEKDLGNGRWSESERGPDWFDCSLRAKARSQELGMGKPGRTRAAGDGKHRGSEIVIGVSCR